MLGTTHVARQVAQTRHTEANEGARAHKHQVQRIAQQTQEVEDPGDYGVQAAGDQRGGKGEGQARQEQQATEERVDIPGVQTQPTAEKPPQGRLDISA